MDTAEIDSALRKNPYTKDKFVGVFPSNCLPKKRLKGYYVVNLDPAHKAGSHWVAFHIEKKNGNNMYFDSYGLGPPYKHFKKFLGKYTRNKKQLQHPLSTTCGQWCLYFILRRCQGWSMKAILKPFYSKRPLINDHVVNVVDEKNFKIKESVIDKKFVRRQIAKQMSESPLWKKILLMKWKKDKKHKRKK